MVEEVGESFQMRVLDFHMSNSKMRHQRMLDPRKLAYMVIVLTVSVVSMSAPTDHLIWKSVER
jgi:hypothetical protein